MGFARAAIFLALATAVLAKYYVAVTDTHLDIDYKEGSAVKCLNHDIFTLPCCHTLEIGSGKAGPFGEETCDGSTQLFADTLAETQKMYPSPEFIMFMGDAAAHTDVSSIYSVVVKTWDRLLGVINSTWPGVPVYPVFGNHDTWPCNLLSPHEDRAIIREVVEKWNKYGYVSTDEAMQTASMWGYYTMLRQPGHRIVVVNNFWTSKENTLIPAHDDDPANQMKWLRPVIESAAAAGEKVWILAHARPIGKQNVRNWTGYFNQLQIDFPGTITRQFYGHTHCDELLIPHTSIGEAATSVAYVIPGGTTFEGYWPSVRIGEYDEDTLEETELLTYHVNLTAANENKQVKLELFYSTADAFHMEDLSLASWESYLRRILTDEGTAVEYMRLRTTKGEPNPGPSTCDQICRTELFCSIAYTTEDLIEACKANPM